MSRLMTTIALSLILLGGCASNAVHHEPDCCCGQADTDRVGCFAPCCSGEAATCANPACTCAPLCPAPREGERRTP